MGEPKSQVKPFDISKWLVWEAFQTVKKNKGAAGVDGVTIEEFERNRDANLYKEAYSRPVWMIFDVGVSQ